MEWSDLSKWRWESVSEVVVPLPLLLTSVLAVPPGQDSVFSGSPSVWSQAVSVGHLDVMTRSVHLLALVGDSGVSSEGNVSTSVELSVDLVRKGHVSLVGVSDGSSS